MYEIVCYEHIADKKKRGRSCGGVCFLLYAMETTTNDSTLEKRERERERERD
jgi:hypothetical protein